jgi:3-dehydroquinate dehydratase-2
MKVLILHGPNLNMVGIREPEIYGSMKLEEINKKLIAFSKSANIEVVCKQSNHEGELIDALHEAHETQDAVIINPGGYTHTSIALRDAIAAIKIPVIEVHMSNIFAREDFRHISTISPVCKGIVAGFGWRSYLAALKTVIDA